MRELFLQIVYGRSQSAFSEDGLAIGAGLEDLGKGLRSQVGTMYGTLKKGPRYLEMAEGYVTAIALDEDDLIIGYKFVSLGKMTDFIKKGDDPNTAYEKACGQYGRVDDAVKLIDPRTDEDVAKYEEVTIMALFESYERRIDKINEVLGSYGISSIEEAEKITKDAGLDVYNQIKGIQPICFENACWAYIVGAAIAIKKDCRRAADAAAAIGEGLQAFCIPGSVADTRKVGLGHGNLGKMLLEEETECFCFLAGHESFAAAEGAIGIAEKANKVRKNPLRVILNGLGKDAAQIISRINGFTFVETEYDPYTNTVKEVFRKSYSTGLRAKVNCYGANDVCEGVAIMHKEGVDVSITGNSTNPTRFQHPVAGTYKKECLEQGKKYFSVASGGGTGRTLHPDNMAAGPASYGMTDTLGRMHSDAQFAGSSSVPAHVEMMGLIGAGNNPMVGMTVAVAVSVQEAAESGKF